MRTAFTQFIVVLGTQFMRWIFLSMLLLLTSCSETPQADDASRTKEVGASEVADRQKIATAAFKSVTDRVRKLHPDSRDWLTPGQETPPIDPEFTLEIQDRIASLANRPVLLIVDVDDVYRVGSNHRFVCHDALGTQFLLDCSPEQAKLIVSSAKSDHRFWEITYAVVCRLSGTRVAYERHRYTEGSESNDEEPKIIEMSLSPKNYVMGVMSDLLHINDFDLDIDWHNLAER